MNPIITLVAPQMGENIGATARAMKNFSLNELRIVAPRDGWPNEQACSNAVRAVNIIDNAKIYDSLEDSIKDLEYLYATTCIKRAMNKDYVFSQNLPLDYPNSAKVGIMFGRENNGLSNEEISLANKIITINTTEFSSLNIAQAVVIICYELFHNSMPTEGIHNIQKLANKEEIEHFLTNLFGKLDKVGFFKAPDKKPAMQQDITNIFTRINNLSSPEVQTLQGIIRSLYTQ
ncbi:MAG: RNA methyltransferase [Rickettsia endosymbiont of Ixodes persulcatus]|nr:RNA methyltransferase [Rickettsia endosymbiont of Ixodes persulcatus]MCZ6903515.1 RNA methyltransferase [Rickettsia endosymbiont of Ixodes persulcatus]MCZ6910775.1 RNA methyltransferase [Rickettsia endosymbiont of Ixodes persulcatus]MCZ6920131.1 RNA methyltransferase [Rickettsia endosymbiont of Ixodes persulcatus]MCZ6924536.1 RNA methyltransferase [Rickettsia endosymbiont of Ixodes persulcatus]